MSGVKRYLIQKTPIGTMMKPNHEGNWIAAEDFDRVNAERDAALAELKRYQSLFNQSEKALDRVHCMYMKRLLDLTGEPQVALVPDEEFVKYFEELKTLKRENSGLQQRLTAADERANVLEGLLAKYYNRSDVCAFMAKDIGAALKPAEPATDEHVCNGCGEKGWTANCKECVPY